MAHGAARPSLLIGQTCPICVQSRQPSMSVRGTTNQDRVTPLFQLASSIFLCSRRAERLARLTPTRQPPTPIQRVIEAICKDEEIMNK